MRAALLCAIVAGLAGLAGCNQVLGVDKFTSIDASASATDAPVDAMREFDAMQVCGDNMVESPEQCDSGGVDTATCDSDCTAPTCGDGHLNTKTQPAEQCDPPNDPTMPNYNSSLPLCNATCQLEVCGNDVTDQGEACDNGTNTAGSGCYMCKSNETCGNNYVDTQLPDNPSKNIGCAQANSPPPTGVQCAEVCDPPNDPSLPGFDATKPLCSRNCLSNMTCGNRIVDTDVGETCDPPNDPALPGYDPSKPLCGADCHGEACGNGVVDAGEQCDNGPADTATCNGSSAGAAACKVPVCGDGYDNTAANEQCDPGMVGKDTASCNSDCTIPTCGDGHLNAAAGEQCDDHNTSACGTCSANCQTPQTGHNCPSGTGCNSSADCTSGLTCNASTHVCQ